MMLKQVDKLGFPAINRGYDAVFRSGSLSLGLEVPLETYARGPTPTMARHVERVQLAEALGFSAVWLRDVPFNVPAFGDAGQMFDPFAYLRRMTPMPYLNPFILASGWVCATSGLTCPHWRRLASIMWR